MPVKMTQKEFFERAKRLGGWRLVSYHIRRECKAHGMECPITAVANHSRKHQWVTIQWKAAAESLGIPYKTALDIVMAADAAHSPFVAKVLSLVPARYRTGGKL